MYFFLQVAVSGIAAGAIYGLVAVGYSLTFSTTRTFNFALGMWVMLGGMLTYCLNVQMGLHSIIVLPAVTALLFALGLLAERISVYPFLRAGNDLWVVSTLAVGFLLIDFAEIIWGRGQNSVPPYFGDEPVLLWSISIRPQQLLTIATVCGIYFGLEYFYRRTLSGKAVRAVSHDREVSSLMGINARRIEALSYATASALAGLAGFLIVPITGAEPHLGTGIGFKAFAVATIAGLTAPRGILLFGLLYGAFEGLVSGYFYPGMRDIIGFTLMIVALYLRPQGLFGQREEERA